MSKSSSSSESFGEGVPFGDPSWYQEWESPYYNDTHRRFRAAVRDFVEREIRPHVFQWDEAKRVPAHEVCQKMATAGILPAIVGGKWPSQWTGDLPVAGGISPEDFDHFHELIVFDELARCGSGGISWGFAGGLRFGLPPLLHFGTPELLQRIAPPCLRGEKIICLAVTEPYAGSDVADLRCEAVKTSDGKNYIVNGEKKWITNGVFADYFTVAVRTGGGGMSGVSLLLIEKTMEGVTARQMDCSGMWCSGTSFVTFEDVKVPVENLIGQENQGFKPIMYNFNHERFTVIVEAVRFARCCLEDAFRYACKRKTFGKRLIDHPVIRNKIAQMARQVEATQAWLDLVTFQMNRMDWNQQKIVLGGPIALLKAQSTKVFEFCAREAAQVFGGLAYSRGGQGERVERLYREVRAYAIPAGSEEIMLDLGVKMAMKRARL